MSEPASLLRQVGQGHLSYKEPVVESKIKPGTGNKVQQKQHGSGGKKVMFWFLALLTTTGATRCCFLGLTFLTHQERLGWMC